MKTERNILIAFILNLLFSIFELFGGFLTGSVAIVSDAIHDAGDAAGIGISYLLEKMSKRQADKTHTYGYSRYSVIGGFITTVILLISSAIMICNAINKIINPTSINYNGVIVFAVTGVIVSVCASLFTHGGKSLNQKAVNLHMLEDALGWIVVLIGAVVIKFTDFVLIDPIVSIGVSLFIMIHACLNLREITVPLLEKAPGNINTEVVKEQLKNVDGVLNVHHIHIWSLDGQNNCATMHFVTDSSSHLIKETIRSELKKIGINHITIETETQGENCHETVCSVDTNLCCEHIHHHHHSH